MKTRIINARIVLPEREIMQGTLNIAEEKIVSVSAGSSADENIVNISEERKKLDFGGDVIIPGLIDLHVHGCKGFDTMDGTITAFKNIAIALLRQGTAAFLPTTMTASNERLNEIISIGAKIKSSVNQAEMLGFHLEGPCISDHYLGRKKDSGREQAGSFGWPG